MAKLFLYLLAGILRMLARALVVIYVVLLMASLVIEPTTPLAIAP
jgi:hypothetical protein